MISPLVPKNADLRSYTWLKLDYARLFASEFFEWQMMLSLELRLSCGVNLCSKYLRDHSLTTIKPWLVGAVKA